MTSDAVPEVMAIIPVRGQDAEEGGVPISLGSRPLLAYTVEAALNSPVVARTVVTTDRASVRDLALELGAEAPFIRPDELAATNVSLDPVLQHCLQWFEQHEGYRPDIVISMAIDYPLRPPELIEQLVNSLVDQPLDTMVSVYEERYPVWREDEYGELSPIGAEPSTPMGLRKPLYRQLAGLALASRGDLILREGRRFGNRVGITPLREARWLLDIREPLGLALAEHLLGNCSAPAEKRV